MLEVMTNPATWLVALATYLALASVFKLWPFRRDVSLGPAAHLPSGKLWNYLRLKGCPDCQTKPFECFTGPSDGVSQHVYCANPKCRSGFNITAALGMAERIGKCKDPYPGDPKHPDPVDLDSKGPRPYHKSERPDPGIVINRKTLARVNEQRAAAGKQMLSHAGFVAVMTIRPPSSESQWLTWFINYGGPLEARHLAYMVADPGENLIIPASIIRSDANVDACPACGINNDSPFPCEHARPGA